MLPSLKPSVGCSEVEMNSNFLKQFEIDTRLINSMKLSCEFLAVHFISVIPFFLLERVFSHVCACCVHVNTELGSRFFLKWL